MDETVNRAAVSQPADWLVFGGIRASSQALASALTLALACGLPLLACAQALTDPTQPPPEARQALSGVDSIAPAVAAGPRLQSILIGSHGREVAVIDGQTVRKGEKFNGALLVKVSKNQVVLRRGGHDQVLTLFPAEPGGKKPPGQP